MWRPTGIRPLRRTTAAPYSGQQAPGPVTAQEGAVNSGLSFNITPSSAEIFVDGNNYGPAANFTANYEPLGIAPGRHHVEVRAPGYQTMTFDADVTAGQVTPYQGTLRPLQ